MTGPAAVRSLGASRLMSEIQVSSLDARQQKLVSNAHVALDRGNFDYTIEVCQQVLVAERGCLAVRKLLRVAQLRRMRGRSRLVAKALGGLTAAQFLLRRGAKDPAKAFAAAERQLALDPTSVAALKQLARAALALDLPETAAFASEAVREQQPDDRENLLLLGEAWLAAKRPAEAVRIANVILKTRPADPGAQDLMRRASIAQTITQGNWDATTTTFRDKLKDEPRVMATEQAAKAVRREG